MDCPLPFQHDPDGVCRLTIHLGVVDQYGHPLEGDYDPAGRHGCQHRDSPEWLAAHHRPRVKPPEPPQERIMDEPQHQTAEQPAIAQGEAHGVQTAVGVPEDFAFDLSKVLPEGGALSPLAATLGGLAIVGGVALKLVPSWLRSRAEMATKRLELKAKRLELEQRAKQDEKQGQDCASRHAACLASINALEERVRLVEGQADRLALEIASAKDAATKLSLTGGKADDERLHALERQVAALAAKVGTGPQEHP